MGCNTQEENAARLASALESQTESLKTAIRALSEDAKWQILFALREDLDSYPLVEISSEAIRDEMADVGYRHDKLAEWSKRAAYRVYSKWPGHDESYQVAMEWAQDLVIEYAKGEGVNLRPIEEEERANNAE